MVLLLEAPAPTAQDLPPAPDLGSGPPPLSPLIILRGAPPSVHPALDMAWALRAREVAAGGTLAPDTLVLLPPEIDAAIDAGHAALAESRRALRALKVARAVPATRVPPGF